MKITLSLDDDLYDLFKAQAKNKNKQGVEDEILERLERFKNIPRDDRAICVFGKDRQDLEKIFQTTVDSPKDLIGKVQRLCSVTVGPIDRPLTAGELTTLKTQAEFAGLPPDEYFRSFANRVIDEALGRI